MAETTYHYVKEPVDGGRLQAEAIAAGLPVSHVNTSGADVYVIMTRELTPAEVTTLDGVVAAHVPPTADARRRDQALATYDDDTSPGALIEKSGEYALLDLINALQRAAGISETGKAQIRNAVRAYIKPGA
jgi:hypothetical protein